MIIVWIGAIEFFTGYITGNIDDNWEEIYNEKVSYQEKAIINLFEGYQNETRQLSDKITTNKIIRAEVGKNDQKKTFDELLKFNIDERVYNVEVYNSRLELIAYKGRQLKPDYVLLQKVMNGKTLSVIKDIGFYTYLIVYSPVKDLKNPSKISGVVLTARLIDIQYQIKNKFFPSTGITEDVFNALHVNIEVIPANSISGYLYIDTTQLQENREVDLLGINKSLIGKVLIPKYDKSLHTEDIFSFSRKITSALIFVLSIILIILFARFLHITDSGLLKLIFFGIFIILIRYLWLQFDFPAGTFDSKIFLPDYYASKFGFGIVKSIGELMVTSLLLLVYSIYSANIIIKRYKNRFRNGSNRDERGSVFYSIIKIILASIAFFILLKIFGIAIQSIIFDSNLRFLDNSKIIPSVELFSLQLVILLIAFAFFILITSLTLYLALQSRVLFKNKFFKRYGIFLFLIFFFCANQIFEFYSYDFGITYEHRLLILFLVFAFAFYISRSALLNKDYTFFSLKNFSIVVLICIITIPLILMENITSQETKFVELIGDKISENEMERVNFTLNTELVSLSENKNVEKYLRDQNKLQKLAFYLWADSKLNTENFNSAVLILDTSKQLLSDFNINESKLNTDSILSFLNTDFFEKGYQIEPGNIYLKEEDLTIGDSLVTDSLGSNLDEFEEEEDESFDEDGNSPVIYENIAILRNDREKFFVGIAPFEKLELKDTRFARVLGYLVIAIDYRSKNFLLRSSLEIFKNYTKDNLLDKLISKPVFTEYVNGEVASSTDRDLGESGLKSIPIFKEYILNRDEKTNWRIENFNNEKFRTYYIMAEPDEVEAEYTDIYERIYTISLKRDDIKLTTLYYLKFIIFAIFVYVILYALFGLVYIYKHRKFNLNFREKLFLSFFVVSVIPIILLAVYTRGFILNKNDTNLQNQIVSDLNILSESLKGKKLVKGSDNTSDSVSITQRDFLQGGISQTSKNFNLFLKNKLVSTTNEELYKSDLLDTRVDADAYYNISFLNKDLYLKTQDKGAFSYLVGYKPYRDPNNNLVGIVSSQLVYKQNEIDEELAETLTFIFGIYFIAIIALLIIVSILTERISKPILELKSATDKLSRGQSNVQLRVKAKNEFKGLVDSFNRMTKELERSKRELKKVEREAAWRDIARRVAHEIKNPLTPMKLSIQHLINVYNENGKSEFPEVLRKTKELISNEIDKLNHIATEFSNFAKLPKRNYEPLDINSIIKEVISLYANHPDVTFKSSLSSDIGKVVGDKEELNRVFHNLIKNAVQAFDGKGTIEVSSYKKGKIVYVEIIDDGVGMDKVVLENLFEPNFSTKSTGMGLGLAILKKSLDDMKAKIAYESKPGTSTKVEIRFKEYIEGKN